MILGECGVECEVCWNTHNGKIRVLTHITLFLRSSSNDGDYIKHEDLLVLLMGLLFNLALKHLLNHVCHVIIISADFLCLSFLVFLCYLK